MVETISVSLESNVVYVTGTVNDVSVTWTNIYGTVWQAEADRAIDDIYRVELTTITSGGQAYNHSLVLYLGLHLITDRTQADVDYAKMLMQKCYNGTATSAEKAELANSPKGIYGAVDLNRVGQAANMVASLLIEAGYPVPIDMYVAWDHDDYFDPDDIQAYLADISTLRSAITVGSYAPAVPADVANYRQANDVEKIIEDVYKLYQNMVMNYCYLGEIYLGEI